MTVDDRGSAPLKLLREPIGELVELDEADIIKVGGWSQDQIIDAGHALDWPDHDIALLIAMLEEMSDT